MPKRKQAKTVKKMAKDKTVKKNIKNRTVKNIIKDRDEIAEGSKVLIDEFIKASQKNAPKEELEAIAGLLDMAKGLYKKFDNELITKASR